MVVSGVTVWTKLFKPFLDSTVASDCEVTTSAGRLFNRRESAAPKARSPSVVVAVRHRRPTVVLSTDIQVLFGCGSETLEWLSGTLCVLEHETSADHAGVVKCDRIFDCYTPDLLPHWVPTANDSSDALWCPRVFGWKGRHILLSSCCCFICVFTYRGLPTTGPRHHLQSGDWTNRHLTSSKRMRRHCETWCGWTDKRRR